MKVVHHLKSLFYFSVIARHMSIKLAAEELHVTQAAVSQQLRLLEEAIGLPLFQRLHRGIALTEAGERLLPMASSAFDTLQRGVDGLSDDADPNVLKVSVLPSFASRWLIPRLGEFYRENPDMKVMFSTTERLETFKDSGADVAIRFGKGDWQGLESHWLMDDGMYPVCHPNCPGAETLATPRDLLACRLLVDSMPDITWDEWFDMQGVAVKKANYSVAYEGAHYVVETALAGQGVGLLRHSLVAELVANGTLIKPFEHVAYLNKAYYLTAPAHHFERPKVRLFREWMEAAMAQFREQNPL